MTALVDPQAAFLAQDPTILREPDYAALARIPPRPPAQRSHRVEHRVELAAAVLAALLLARRYLRKQDTPKPASVREQALAAWSLAGPTWLKLAVPVIFGLYTARKVGNVGSGLTEAERRALAVNYATSLGDYLGSSSADALADGFDRQLARGWHPDVAWHRSGEGYGLDTRTTRGFLDSLLAGTQKGRHETVGRAAKAAVNKALTHRADELAGNEVHTAVQSGNSAAWLWLERTGRLPAGSKKEWDAHTKPTSCAVCRELHSQQVPVGEPFVLRDGVKLWAPQAHPNCHCTVEFVGGNLGGGRLSKTYNPQEKREPKGGPHGGRWVRTKERDVDPQVEAIMEQARRQAGEKTKPEPTFGELEFGEGLTFGEPTFGEGLTFGEPTFGEPTFGEPKAKTEAKTKAQFAQAARRRVVRQHVMLMVPDVPKPPPDRPRNKPGMYLPMDHVQAYFGRDDPPRREVNFDAISDYLREVHGRVRPVRAHAYWSPWEAVEKSDIGNAVDDAQWTRIMGHVVPLWHYAFDNPSEFLAPGGDLTDEEIAEIGMRAGLPAHWPTSKQRDYLQEPIEEMGQSNVREAFADYMVWVRPELLPDLPEYYNEFGDAIMPSGEQLSHALMATIGVDLENQPIPAVMTFNQGYNEGGPENLDGTYEVAFVSYNSAVAQFNYQVPPGSVGLIEYHMDPKRQRSPGGSRFE